jgi:hypothetical protein
MTAFGLTLNSSCYAALIQTHKNHRPVNQVTFQKVGITCYIPVMNLILHDLPVSNPVFSSKAFNLFTM